MFSKFLTGFLLLAAAGSHAGVIINNTRVIYRQADGEAVVQLRNDGKGPVLVQAWIDDGDMKARIESLNVPFTLIPAVARIDSGRGQAVRVLQTRDDLPADRESVFWFNVLEIPPKPTEHMAAGDNLLQFSFRSRIKFFYRPKGLPSSSQDALKQLRFVIGRSADGAPKVVVRNPSPYHVTFRNIFLRQNEDGPVLATLGETDARMVSPAGELSIPLQWVNNVASTTGAQVFFTAINDQGGDTDVQRAAVGGTGKN